MTDKEKLSAIKAEIENLIEEVKAYILTDGSNMWYGKGRLDALSNLMGFCGTLPQEQGDMDEVSDGYHTFNELYYYRMLYNAAFFNLLPKHMVHKSKKHHDGEECFGGGWFIVMANLPTGQISNHYELKDWDLFQIPEKETSDEWDGHTPQQAAERLRKYLEDSPTLIGLNRLGEEWDFQDALAKAWQSYTDRGSATVDALEENTQELSFAKGFKAGVEWQKQRMIDKACEWLEGHLIDYWSQKVTDYGDFINDFRKAMEDESK